METAAPPKRTVQIRRPSAAVLAAKAAGEAAAAAEPNGGPGEASAVKRRGPGRPPSKQPPPKLVKRGIVDAPQDPANRLEFAFEEPTVFKTLFSYFKNVQAREIHIRCTPTGITMFARNHSKNSRIVAHIAGAYVNWHYCEGEFWFGLNREHVEKMFSSIDKSLGKITIISTHEDPLTITFVFKDFEFDSDSTYRHKVSKFDDDADLYEAEDALTPDSLQDFPIEFTLTAKKFKKLVGDASNYSEVLTIEKLGERPLQFVYTKAELLYNEVYRDASKIAMRSLIRDGEVFRCTIKLENVKSLATSMVTDNVKILCRQDDDILFRSAIDQRALVVSTLTKLA
jgi:hypothetical protein